MENIIVEHYAGSKMYGTMHEGSDEDVRGVFVVPEYITNTPFYSRDEFEVFNDGSHEDRQLWELTKFVREVAGCSPSYIESLFVPSSQVIKSSNTYSYLKSVSDNFITLGLAKGYLGFAESQFEQVLKSFKTKSSPNAKRAALIEMHGYDTKNAMHALRAVRMAQEIALTGKVNVFRPDADELRKVHVDGYYSYDTFCSIFFELVAKTTKAISENHLSLPDKIERDVAAKILLRAQKRAYGEFQFFV